MKCEICGEREATIQISKGSGLSQKEQYLCEHCAGQTMDINYNQAENPFDIQTLLQMLANNAKTEQETAEEHACPTCGSTLQSVVQNGLFGCSHCYEYFERYVPEIVTRVQLNQQRHIGKIPSQAHDTLKLKRDIESLERTLQEKVKVQAFEEAAVVRDQIQALKDGGADE
ncbi:UvrB/uvrC motif protein [Jeotgalicoccus aerolatus]|uniref:Protein arginine kinase activator n=1 Tax=Jeotgalicoccus aerolatus TaxID=709510 RepID=A0ABS4HM58_9STAP|nr:UvrB/UvrC motif-containing protein [Jeotgalicoccus aerolatus]MBP1952010.1 protein arginine kinase activator [Jeotgalicoccus aerolatus]GGE05230.1 UvrB/UvrC protein [Jeotgalicoccus aerolatus]CAD2071295.1 UvrB/uvrC motif protein [Jeotgalicoccus aerolatus]